MESELLLAVPRGGVPDDGGPVHPGTQDEVAGLVPLESKYWTFVLAKSLLQLARG